MRIAKRERRVLLRVKRPTIVLLILGATVAGCGGKRVDLSQYETPTALMEASLAAYRRGDCGAAEPGFQQLSFMIAARDPAQAEIRYYLAECLLRDGKRLEAARQFQRLSNEFPRHNLAPDALLRAGDAFAELWRNPELDPTYGETALATYRELFGRYPTSTAAERARLRVAQLGEMFAEKAFKAGVFYMRLRAYDSAILFFKDIVAEYPQSSFAPKAVLRLVEAYTKIGYDEDRREMCQYLLQYYPTTDGAEKACPTAEGAR